MLVPTDPFVTIHVFASPHRSTTTESPLMSQNSSNVFGLTSNFDIDKSLMPSFHLNINADEVFGKISPKDLLMSQEWQTSSMQSESEMLGNTYKIF